MTRNNSSKLILPLILAGLIFPLFTAIAQTAAISFFPTQIIQGEPIMVTVEGITSTSLIKSISFDGAPLGVFLYKNKATAFVGVDLNKKPGIYKILAKLSDGRTLEKYITINKRPKIEAPLGVPEKLGGNTTTSQKTLVTTLADENASLANIHTGTRSFWTEKFRWPLKEITVTDPYGYSRQTGAYRIAHKGTDFRAKEGTPVTALNRGVVRIVKTYRNYGKTIVVDHGLGLMSFYMHLSKIKVNAGELVGPGQTIGLSGQTGYAESPHLHLTVRINGSSIDPLKFFELFR